MNENERLVHDALTGSGYEVLRSGWPDFLVTHPTGRVFGLEWKELGTRDLVRPNQERMHDALARAGLPTLVAWSLTEVFGYRPPEPITTQSVGLARVRSNLENHIDRLERDITCLIAERNAMLEEWRELRAQRDALAVEVETAERLRRSLAGVEGE